MSADQAISSGDARGAFRGLGMGLGAVLFRGGACQIGSQLGQAGARLGLAGGAAAFGADAVEQFASGDVGAGLGSVAQGLFLAFSAGRSCFAAGTPLVLADGSHKPIEAIRPGESVLSRDEADPAGVPAGKAVEEVFERTAELVRLTLAGGRVVETTGEHPFWHLGRQEWVAAQELRAGDRLGTLAGDGVAVEGVEATGRWARVFNLRVADWHTYSVGDAAWGFSLWAHNRYGGDGGEQVARDLLRKQGYDILGTISSASKNGIDIVARNRATKRVEFFEVKTGSKSRAPRLNADQRQGAAFFVWDRLQLAAGNNYHPNWVSVRGGHVRGFARSIIGELQALARAGGGTPKDYILGQIIQITNFRPGVAGANVSVSFLPW